MNKQSWAVGDWVWQRTGRVLAMVVACFRKYESWVKAREIMLRDLAAEEMSRVFAHWIRRELKGFFRPGSIGVLVSL